MGSTQASPAPSSSRLILEHSRPSSATFSTQASSYLGAYSEQPPQPAASPAVPLVRLPTCIRAREKNWWSGLQAVELHELLDAASKFPPITRASLSELDMPRFINDEALRHKLNFEPGAQFWPNYETAFGRQCRNAAEWYWAALEIELLLFIKPGLHALPVEAESLRQNARLGRLSRLFETLKDILQVLLRREQTFAIDELLDISCIMQQIEHNACDMAKLAEWIATLLTTSCSPQRDSDVAQAASQIKIAASRGDPSAMIDGIESLFSMLETMKLDAANHQMRCLRYDLINDSVAFEQRMFFYPQQVMANHQSRAWFERQCEDTYFAEDGEIFQSIPARSFEFGQSAIVRALVGNVAAPSEPLPATFDFDRGRLGQLAQDFELHVRQDLLWGIVDVFLRRTWGRDVPHRQEIDEIVARAQLVYGSAGAGSLAPLRDIALEVFRAINARYGRPQRGGAAPIPDDPLLRIRLGRLQASTPERATVRERLRRDLLARVRREIAEVADATPLFMHLRYARDWQQCSQDAAATLATLDSMARRIAHVAILHWRVWGPILYQQPSGGP